MRVIFDKEIAEKKVKKYKKCDKFADNILKIAKLVIFPFLVSFTVLWNTKIENYNALYKVLGYICLISLAILLVCLVCIIFYILFCAYAYQNDSNVEYCMLTADKTILDNKVLFSVGDDCYETNYSMSDFDKVEVIVICEDKNGTVTKESLHKNFKCVFKQNINEMIIDLIEGVVYHPYKKLKESV